MIYHVIIIETFLLCALTAYYCGGILPYTVSNNKNYSSNLDGIRGFLALSVLIHHGFIYYFYANTGIWQGPPPGFFNNNDTLPPTKLFVILGQFSVSIFFMITGFLFWKKVIASNGKISYKQFLKSRFRRIAPMYFASVLISFILIIYFTNSVIHEPLHSIIQKTFKWMLVGIPEKIPYVINELNITHIVPPIWTLHYEWMFYFALPILAILLKYTLRLKYLVIITVIAIILAKIQFQYYYLFIFGIFAAHINSNSRIHNILKTSRMLEFCGVASLIISFTCFGTSYAADAIIFEAIFFIYITNSNSKLLVYVLQNKAMKVLGTCSYSIYMLHMPLLALSATMLLKYTQIQNVSLVEWLGFLIIVALFVVLSSVFTFRFIEHKFIIKRS